MNLEYESSRNSRGTLQISKLREFSYESKYRRLGIGISHAQEHAAKAILTKTA